MRVLFDTVNVRSPGGLSQIVEIPRCVEQAGVEDSEVVLLAHRDVLPESDGKRVRVRHAERVGGLAGFRRWVKRDLPGLGERHRADVVFSLGGMLSRELVRGFATVNYINNMLPFTPELLRDFPLWSSRRWRLEVLQRIYVHSCRMADAVVAPSRYGIDQVVRYSGDIDERCFVAPNPIALDVQHGETPPPHPHDGRPFFFYLSVVVWYKNHLNLIEAYRRAREAGHDLPDLLIAGPSNDAAYTERIRRAIEEGGFDGRVRYLGRVPRETIPGYLHHATINVFPSLCETSSLVQSEILGAGGVMACSDCGPMPEVAGGAAELFDPHDPDSIAEVLVRLSRDEARRAELRRLAKGVATERTAEVFWSAAWRAIEYAAARRNRGGTRQERRASADA